MGAESDFSVLIIEDDPIFGEVLVETMEDMTAYHSTVTLSGSLSDGLSFANSETVDIVLLDLTLPDSSGIETVSSFLAQSPDVPVIVLTGHVDEQLGHEAIQAGAQDFLSKTKMAPELLQRAIRYAMERQAAVTALKQSERRYAAIAENLPNGFVHILDDEYRILFSRGKALAELDIDPSRLEGALLKAVVGDNWDVLRWQLEPAYAGAQTTFERAYGEHTFVINAVPLNRQKGRAHSILVLGVDVTEMKQAEEERLELMSQLRQGEKLRAVGQLAGGIAHDFNNQLNAILGYADTLQLRLQDDELRDYARRISVICRRSGEMTGKLLSFARRRDAVHAPVNIHELIRESIHLLGNNERLVVCEHLNAEQTMVMGDPAELQNAVLNICINARDAMPEGGTLSVTTTNLHLDDERSTHVQAGDYILIEIADTGCGIDEITLARIFEPFFTTKPEGEGSGMGLASVYGTVRSHRGSIDVETQEGKGTTFNVYLPLTTSAFIPNTTPNEHVGRGRGARVMVVDDNKQMLDVLKKSLTHLEYRARTYNTPTAALRDFDNDPWMIDLVITDVNMPEINGVAMIRQMLELRPDLPVILITGYAIEDEDASVLKRPNCTLLRKPFALRELAAAAAQMLTH